MKLWSTRAPMVKWLRYGFIAPNSGLISKPQRARRGKPRERLKQHLAIRMEPNEGAICSYTSVSTIWPPTSSACAMPEYKIEIPGSVVWDKFEMITPGVHSACKRCEKSITSPCSLQCIQRNTEVKANLESIKEPQRHHTLPWWTAVASPADVLSDAQRNEP